MKDKSKNVPQMRFRDENGEVFPEFLCSTIGELGVFIKGAPLSKMDISPEGTPMILYGELYTTYSEIATYVKRKTMKDAKPEQYSKVGDVLIPTSGESPEEISTATCILVPNVILAGDLYIYRSSEIDGRIMSYILNYVLKSRIASIAQGKSIVHIRAKEIGKIRISFPTLPEQTRIADFFSKIDAYIERQEKVIEKLEEEKRGLMQRIFSQEVRFRDENGEAFPDWEEKRLGEVLNERKQYFTKSGKYKHVTLAKEGIFDKNERYDRDFLVKSDNKKYKLTKFNDICYNPANLKFGVICRNNYGDAIFSPIYVTYEVTKDANPGYLEAFLCRKSFISKLRKFEEGTVYERMAVSSDDFQNYMTEIPCLAEQLYIADFFLKIGKLLEKEKCILENWKLLKKGLLQQMFV